MLSELIITILFRAIPEACIYMFGVCAFSKEKISRKSYVTSSMILAVLLIIISKLPISFGIHTILVVMSTIGLAVGVNKLNVMYSISVTILVFVVQFISEALNIVIIEKIFNMDIAEAMSTPISKCIYGIPSLLIIFFTILLGKILKSKLLRGKNECNSESM